jgi:hypothetical protein
VRITTNGKAGVIAFEHMTYSIREKARAIPGRKKWKSDNELWFELTTPCIQYVLFAFPSATWVDYDPLDKLDRLKRQEDETRLLKSKDVVLPPEFYKFPFKTKPRDHQAKAFFLSRDKELFGLFMEMGTGKTKVILDTAAYLYADGRIDTVLAVAPNGVHTQWVDEQIPSHLPEWCKAQAIAWTSNVTKTWERNWDAVLGHQGGLRFFSMNVDSFSQKEGRGLMAARRILTSGRALLVIDESSKIKAFNNRTKQLLSLAPLAPFRRIMSGSPITQGIEDLYTQMKFLDDGILGFSTKAAFEDYYCVRRAVPGAPNHVTQIVGYQNVDEIRDRIEGYTYRVTKAECLDLPEKQYVTRHVELTPEQKKLYKAVKEEAVVEVNGQFVDLQRAITKLVKMQQIVCGFIRDEEGNDHELPSNRVDACLDVIEEAQGKVIVWTRFSHDIAVISDALTRARIGHCTYHGKQDNSRNEKELARFKTDPACRVMVANSQKGGIGLNLTVASTCVYFSNDFNAETRWQSEDRIHRDGQANQCVYVDLVARGTTDVKVLNALLEKKDFADSVLDVKRILAEEQA